MLPVPLHLTAVQRRLAPLIAASFLGGMALWVPIEKLFIAQIGFTPQSVGLMAAAYAAVVPLLEIPSGILADRWSRRGVLVIGNVGAMASVLVGGLATGVPTYVVAALLLGVYFAMQSGTFEAVVYDTLLEETGSSERFERLVGRIRFAESASLVLSAIAGGLLAAATSLRVAYLATLPFLALSTVCLLAFREPRLHETGEYRTIREHVGVTVRTLRRDPRLVPIVALLVLTAVLTQAVIEFGPLWLVEAGTGAGSFGPAWAALMAALGIGGLLAGWVRLDTRRMTAGVMGLLPAAGIVLVTVDHPAVATAAQATLVVLPVAVGISLTRRLHDAVASDIRSGVASGVGALTWAVFLPFALGFGMLSERLGVRPAGWTLVGLAAAVAALLPVVHASGRDRAAVRPVEGGCGSEPAPEPVAA
jgi:MFS family permease